ncbi:MAG: LemA family protein [Synergistetes bacterium ADurb.BinA166]|nr:MAG: LemA family protein [Synergistetes bacterium ADurb.BinA166]
MTLYVLAGIAAVVLLWGVAIYNGLIKRKNLKDEAWSGIDVQLKRRFDVVPNLVETVKGYAAHEKEVFTKVTEARAAVGRAQSVAERAESENMLTGALRSLFAVAEGYPDLKANANFLQLQEQISVLENDIQMSRRYYNGAARDYNIAAATFPSVLVAKQFGFDKADYFEADEGERARPEVSFR